MINLLRSHAQRIYDSTLLEILQRERADIRQSRLVAEMAVFNWLWDREFEELCKTDPLHRARLRTLFLSEFCPSLDTLWGKGHLQVLPAGSNRRGQRFYREMGS